MDFFSTATLAAPADGDASSQNHFALAVAARAPLSLPVTLTVPLPESPMANMSLSPSPAPSAPATALSITTITPSSIDAFILDPAVLILDIRPHAAFSSARIPHAVSLSVPSTLLRRPLFSLEKLSTMLPSQNSRARFSTWPSASKILVYDSDASTIPPSSNIHGLLHKFHNDHFSGQLAWIQGGFQAIWRERRDLVDTSPPAPDNDEDEDDVHANSNQTASIMLHRPNVLRASHLPTSAFSHTSTTAFQSRPASRRTAPLSLSGRFAQANPATAKNHNEPPTMTMTMAMPSQDRPAFNPFFDTIRQNIELSHGITDRIPLRLPRRVRRRIHELPFPWLQQIARRAANMPSSYHRAHRLSSSSASSEGDDSGADPADVEEGTEALAMQFYRIELAEQRRLMGVMEHHSKESGGLHSDPTQPSMNFPFSITAGVEKGAKNRYRNIWPFEHARVRLHQKREADDDYINASYVQPIGTTKRYIATQGPLPATYTNFWTLIWEQNVHVIVMLTREVEGAMVKCGCYWKDTRYGPLSLRLVDAVGEESNVTTPPSALPFPSKHSTAQATASAAGGFFRPEYVVHEHATGHKKPPSPIIRRTFELTHSEYPHAQPRKVVQLQYLEWPDMNVPDDPRGILGLVNELDQVLHEVGGDNKMGDGGLGIARGLDGEIRPGSQELDPHTGITRHALGRVAPVLLHCSAGVGRTGGFIAVDAVLDAVRRELRTQASRKQHEQSAITVSGGIAMDIDTISGMDTKMRMSPQAPGTSPALSSPPKQGSRVETAIFEAARGSGASSLYPVVTVPILVSVGRTAHAPGGGLQTRGHVGGASNDSALVVHVPVAPNDSGTRTPVQFKHDGWVSGGAGPIGGESLTRRWAEGVRDETRRETQLREPLQKELLNREQLTQHQRKILELRQKQSQQQNDQPPSSSPPPPSSSSPPAIGSFSGSGSSGTEDSLFTFSTAPPPSSSQSRHGTSISSASTPSFFLPPSLRSAPGNPPAATQGKRVTLPVVGEAAEHRIRTSSAPVRATVPLGPSPLASASSSAPWLAMDGVPSQNVVTPLSLGGGEAIAQPGSGLAHELAPRSPSTTLGSIHDKQDNALATNLMPKSQPNSPPDIDLSPPYIRPTAPSSLGGMQDSSARDMRTISRITRVDYKEPRRLHCSDPPPALSTFEEPICELLQDMREQRMSLCQSLRQYVFVHAAVIEGALMVVDEERAATGSAGMGASGVSGGSRYSYGQSQPGMGARISSGEGSTMSSSSTGKRGASPTELLKEGRRGEVSPSKKPSLKRKPLREDYVSRGDGKK